MEDEFLSKCLYPPEPMEISKQIKHFENYKLQLDKIVFELLDWEKQRVLAESQRIEDKINSLKYIKELFEKSKFY